MVKPGEQNPPHSRSICPMKPLTCSVSDVTIVQLFPKRTHQVSAGQLLSQCGWVEAKLCVESLDKKIFKDAGQTVVILEQKVLFSGSLPR